MNFIKLPQLINNYEFSTSACMLMLALSFGVYTASRQTATAIRDNANIFNDLTIGGNVEIGTIFSTVR